MAELSDNHVLREKKAAQPEFWIAAIDERKELSADVLKLVAGGCADLDFVHVNFKCEHTFAGPNDQLTDGGGYRTHDLQTSTARRHSSHRKVRRCVILVRRHLIHTKMLRQNESPTVQSSANPP